MPEVAMTTSTAFDQPHPLRTTRLAFVVGVVFECLASHEIVTLWFAKLL